MLVVPAIVCLLEDVEGVAVVLFRPFGDLADGVKDLLLRTREVSTKLRSVTQYPLHG